jgi:hypothetical protein
MLYTLILLRGSGSDNVMMLVCPTKIVVVTCKKDEWENESSIRAAFLRPYLAMTHRLLVHPRVLTAAETIIGSTLAVGGVCCALSSVCHDNTLLVRFISSLCWGCRPQ